MRIAGSESLMFRRLNRKWISVMSACGVLGPSWRIAIRTACRIALRSASGGVDTSSISARWSVFQRHFNGVDRPAGQPKVMATPVEQPPSARVSSWIRLFGPSVHCPQQPAKASSADQCSGPTPPVVCSMGALPPAPGSTLAVAPPRSGQLLCLAAINWNRRLDRAKLPAAPPVLPA